MHSLTGENADSTVWSTPDDIKVASRGDLAPLDGALAEADVVRVWVRAVASANFFLPGVIDTLSRLKSRPPELIARISVECHAAESVARLASGAARVELWVPHYLAGSTDHGLHGPSTTGFLDRVKSERSDKARPVFEIDRGNVDRLVDIVKLAAQLGCCAVGFVPRFIANEEQVPHSVFFDRARFNDNLDRALKEGKRRRIFVEGIKFGSQGDRDRNYIAPRKLVAIELDVLETGNRTARRGDGNVVTAVQRGGRCLTVSEPPFVHMDVAESHFERAVLQSRAFVERAAVQSQGENLLAEHGALFDRYGLDAKLYLDVARQLGISLPAAVRSDGPASIAALNEHIERRVFDRARANRTEVVIDLTKPFLGINWGCARRNLLPDQRQFWRTFNQWQVPTVFVQVEPGRDYSVRTVVHNATPGNSIDFLRLACNDFVPLDQALSWGTQGCVHVCTVPAAVIDAAAGRLCLSYAIARQIQKGPPAQIGLRMVTVEAAQGSISMVHRAAIRFRTALKMIYFKAPGARERRLGYGKLIPPADFPELIVYFSEAEHAADVVRSEGCAAEGHESVVAAFALMIADTLHREGAASAINRTLARLKDIVERRVDWLKFPPVEHRYSDTEVTYAFLSVVRKIFRGRVPDGETLGFFTALTKKDPVVRPAWLAVADCHLDAGRIDDAIHAARSATHRDACCVISQEALRRAYLAKIADRKTPVVDGVPLYDLTDRFCSVPFDRIETAKDGIVWTCCPAWLGAPIGNMHRMDWESAWNSDQAALMRASILDGSFRYCNKGVCPAILADDLPRRSEVADPYFRHYIDNDIVKIPEGPREISISHDPSCNLSCPQCRQGFILADEDKNKEFAGTIDSFIKPLIEFAQFDRSTILMSGDGEIFISPHYQDVLALFDPKKHADVTINLLSNGLVFEAGWKKLPNIHGLVRSVTISTDAASEEIYRLTRGGSWEKLCRNLAYVSSLRKRGEIKRFGIHYAVQTCNYRDMKRMVEIGLDLGVDRIAFAILRNSGVYEAPDYATRCIFEASHPDHDKFVAELANPIFRHPIVDLGQFAGFLGNAK